MNILRNFPVANLTSMGIGGFSSCACFPDSSDEFLALLKEFSTDKKKFLLLSGGYNTVFQDGFIEVPLIVCRYPGFFSISDTIICDASLELNNFLRFCLKSGVGGYEFLTGIPGSVGGAVCGNAGAYGDSIGNYLVRASVFSSSENRVFTVDSSFFHFDYRHSFLKENPFYLLSAEFRIPFSASAEKISSGMRAIQDQRDSKLPPAGTKSAGSFFKNVQVPGESRKTAAAVFIQKTGLKGKRIGDIQVSEYHANFIVNRGKASFSDLLKLVSMVKESVKKQSGVTLEEEVRYLPGI